MKKLILIGIVFCLFLFTGCSSDSSDCCPCCDYSDNPTPYNVYVVCDNQEIWDMRGKIKDFSCECDNYGCSDFPTERVCNYGVWAKENGNIFYEQGIIHCSEVIGKDRRCN